MNQRTQITAGTDVVALRMQVVGFDSNDPMNDIRVLPM
jgi:hypothetical protein